MDIIDFHGFFDGKFTHVDEEGYDRYDREYNADDLARVIGTFYLNGVFPHDSKALGIAPGGDLELLINKGQGHIEGRFFELQEGKTLTLKDPDPNYLRIDRVVVQLNIGERKVKIVVKEGQPSSQPKPPALERTKNIYELGLANVTVRPGVSRVSYSDIEDTRFNKATCGVVAHALERLDINDLRDKYSSDLIELIEEFDKTIIQNESSMDDKIAEFEKYVEREKEYIQDLVDQLNELLESDDIIGEINKLIESKQDKQIKDRGNSKKYELFFEDGQLYYEEVE